MTKEEMKEKAIAQLERISRNIASIGEEEDWTDFIIQELEQEPKSEWEKDHEILKAYSDGANEVLEKLRTEIIEKFGGSECAEECGCLYELLEVIDKYKGEKGAEHESNND